MSQPFFQQYAQQEYPQQGFGQGFPQQGPPGYQQYAQQPPPNYGPPSQQQQQGGPGLAQGSIDDFFSQPSVGGGPALKFEVGTRHAGIVARAITNADIQQQTVPGTNNPATYRDGRPKFVMKVPLLVQQSQAHPDGQAQWYVSGGARDELVRAMAEAGAPDGPPEMGAGIIIECTGTRPAGQGMNPAKVYRVQYQRPTKATQNAAAQAEESAQAQPPAPAAQQSPPPAVQGNAPAAPQPPDDMSPDQQSLLAGLIGSPQG